MCRQFYGVWGFAWPHGVPSRTLQIVTQCCSSLCLINNLKQHQAQHGNRSIEKESTHLSVGLAFTGHTHLSKCMRECDVAPVSWQSRKLDTLAMSLRHQKNVSYTAACLRVHLPRAAFGWLG